MATTKTKPETLATITVDTCEAYIAFRLAAKCTDSEPIRYALSGIWIGLDRNQVLTIVGTDGRRLAAIQPGGNYSDSFADIPGGIIVDPKPIRKEFGKLRGKNNALLEIKVFRESVSLTWHNLKTKKSYSVCADRIQGRFPKWQDIIKPQSGVSGSANLVSDDWKTAIDSALERPVGFDVSINGKTTIKQDPVNVELKTSSHIGEDIVSCLNLDYLRDYLESMPDKNHSLDWFDEHSQVQLRSESGKASYIVMPLSKNRG